MKKILTTTLILGAMSAANTVSAAPIIIDDFNGTTFSGSAPLTGTAAGNSSAGYVRTVDSTSSGNFTDVGLNTPTTPGAYSHSQGAGVTGTSQVNYNLGGIDLTAGANAFRIQLQQIDLSGFFGVIVDSISYQLSSTAVIVANGGTLPSYADILFSDLGGIANLSSANTVSLFVNGSTTAALDAVLDNFGTVCSTATASGGVGAQPGTGNCNPPTTVAAPGVLPLLGIGLAALGFGRRKVSL